MTKPTQLLCQDAVFKGASTDAKILDYWRWSGSHLLDNTLRGNLAEFLVARALNADGEPRMEWASWDIEYPRDSGADPVKIEVKSAAYAQSWHQAKASTISYDIAKRKWIWNPRTGKSKMLDPPRRIADVYVFALLRRCDEQDRIDPNEHKPDPLDLRDWEFHVLDRITLDQQARDQKRIGLNPLKKLVENSNGAGPISYDGIKKAVDKLCLRTAASGQ